MLRISRLTDYATVILAALATDPARLQTSACLAEQTKLALPTVSKVLKQLQRAGLVASTRGLRGGYQLARPATETEDHRGGAGSACWSSGALRGSRRTGHRKTTAMASRSATESNSTHG